MRIYPSVLTLKENHLSNFTCSFNRSEGTIKWIVKNVTYDSTANLPYNHREHIIQSGIVLTIEYASVMQNERSYCCEQLQWNQVIKSNIGILYVGKRNSGSFFC